MRLVIHVEDKEINNDMCQYRVRSDFLVPYIVIKFKGKMPIDSIRIGPKNNMNIDIIDKGLRLFLKKYNYQDIDIIPSQIKLRY